MFRLKHNLKNLKNLPIGILDLWLPAFSKLQFCPWSKVTGHLSMMLMSSLVLRPVLVRSFIGREADRVSFNPWDFSFVKNTAVIGFWLKEAKWEVRYMKNQNLIFTVVYPRICKRRGILFQILWLLFFLGVQSAKCHRKTTSTASQWSHKINKVPLLLQNLAHE